MTTEANSSHNPCRYGYLYGLQALGSSLVAIGQVKPHKPRSQTAPSIATLGDYYLYTTPRAAFERSLAGKRVVLPLQTATYASALDPDSVTFASPLELNSFDTDTGPALLGDYLAHLYLMGGEEAVSSFFDRNNHPAAVASLRRTVEAQLWELADDPSGDLATDALRLARIVTQPILPNPSARSFFANEVRPVILSSWGLAEIFEKDGVLALDWTDSDVATGEETGVFSLQTSKRSVGASARLSFTAFLRPDAEDTPAVVLLHDRGILEVVPLLEPTSFSTAREVAADWAEAIPVVGNTARAVVTTAFHFSRPKGPLPTVVEGLSNHPYQKATALALEAPSFHDFGSALSAADAAGASAGLTPELRRELRRRMLADSATGTPRWRYRSHIAAEVLELAHHQELGQELPPPPVVSRGPVSEDLALRSESSFHRFSEAAELVDLTDSGPYGDTPESEPVTIEGADPYLELERLAQVLSVLPEVTTQTRSNARVSAQPSPADTNPELSEHPESSL